MVVGGEGIVEHLVNMISIQNFMHETFDIQG